MSTIVHPVDEVLPASRLILMGLQHVLAMAASPIAAVFLVSKTLNLPGDVTANMISAALLVCGIGSLLQSLGPWGIGARLPFIVVPGGATTVIFLSIAQQTNLRVAAGAVILSAAICLLILPVFRRFLRFFPKVVIGTMLIIVAVNLVKVYGGVVAGIPGSPGFGDPKAIGLALAAILSTMIFACALKGVGKQLAVMLGLVCGCGLALLMGAMNFSGQFPTALVSLPTILPFGLPEFDLIASLPLIIFSIFIMVDASAQTAAVGMIVEKDLDLSEAAPKTIRGDMLTSLIGSLFGTSIMVTTVEATGIVKATGVKSRFVTATSGAMLLVLACFAPLGYFVNAIPAAVVGGTAVLVFCIIAVVGIDILRSVDLHDHDNLYIIAIGLAMGLLPILVPNFYKEFPKLVQMLFGNGLSAGTIAAVVASTIFQLRRSKSESALVHSS